MEEEMQIENPRSKKIKVEHEGGGFLPEDLMREILSRLSVKSLLRYMSVSRRWKSLISHNSFKKLHRQKVLNINNPPLLLAFQYSDKKNYFLTTFNFHGKVIKEWSLPITSSTPYLSMLPFPSQSKFVCFFDGKKFYLCNPSIRRIFRLPNPPFGPLLIQINYVSGLAYVPSIDEYTILYLVKSDLDIWRCMMLTISMSNDDDHVHYNSWRSFDVAAISHLAVSRPFGVFGIFISGAFYWLMFDKKVRKYVILSFNMENQGFSTIRLPKEFENNLGDFRQSLLEIKEKLYIRTILYIPQTFKLWLLSDVKNQLWTQSWSINLKCIPHRLEKSFDTLNLIIYMREYLQNFNESYEDILRDIRKFKVKNRALSGVEIHTNIFSL